jgi:hypothetical protein
MTRTASPERKSRTLHAVQRCETCDRESYAGERHPCRFEIACTCWYGIPCSGRGTIAGTRADRKAAGL